MGQQNPRPAAPPMAMGTTNPGGNLTQSRAPQYQQLPYLQPMQQLLQTQMPAVASPNSLNTTKPPQYGGGQPFAWGLNAAKSMNEY